MIVRELRRVIFLVGPFVVLILLSASLWRSHTDILRSHVGALLGGTTRPNHATSLGPETHRKPTLTPNETHYEIYSVTAPSGRYFDVRFGKHAYNVNIIPHPKYNNSWYAVAQLWQGPDDEDKSFKQVGCVAQFIDGTMMCIDYMAALSYKPTSGGHCEGDLSYFNLNVGPHDARVFFGPQNPLTIFGSNSGFTCFGLWMQDFRELVEWEHQGGSDAYKDETELKRPAPYSVVEKNYFVFWDKHDVMHVHYDIFPKRAYAKLERDGSFGSELSATTAPQDEKCLARYLPKMPERLESIHQATNSLKITLCRRADKDCVPSDENTFILTIIQHKTYYDWHGEYEPYAVLFRQRAPFELYAISKKPLWIHGRQRHTGRRTDMFYVTSVNWRDRGVNYHGYLDDVVFVGFGVEDKFAGAIDVQAGDLLVDMGFCDEL